MKHRDLILLALPVSILMLAALLVGLLVMQFRAFERSYMEDAKASLAQNTRFVANLILPDLRRGDIAAVAERIDFFRGKPLRITVIDAQGHVVADSDVDAAGLANHADRPELATPEDATDFITRYSATMQAFLLYHAIHEEGWTVRSSLPMDVVGRAVRQVRLTVVLAIVLGAGLAGFVALYLLLRVRPHFNALQASAVAIARGLLETPIVVPRNGLLRELGKAIAVMARQLRSRIEDLRRERNEFDALFNALREPLLLVAQTGEVLSSNRAAARLFGEAVRRPGFCVERIACHDLVYYVREAFEQPALRGREIAFDDHGTARSLLVHAVRIEREGALCILLLLTDLTDLRRLEGIRSDFVANVSHEIKTPLTAILSTVETLTEMPLDAEGRAKCLDILARQARRLNDLVQDILSLANIERRQGVPQEGFAAVRLDEVLLDAFALCQDEAERVGVNLHTATTPLPELSVRGDARLLEQSVVNLIGNAFRHSGSATVTVGLCRVGDEALITVRDEGCGIEAEHLPRLFERFYRVDKGRSRERGGTGLGLAIVKHTALLHHGTVEVASTPGKGTCFTLRLRGAL